jgi:hypothetical protein
MIVPLPVTPDERFTVRWCDPFRGFLRGLGPGYAVFDGDRRVTSTTYATRAEAEQHRDNIAALYARYRW